MAKERKVIEKDGKRWALTEANVTGIGCVGSAATRYEQLLSDLVEVYGAKHVADGFMTWRCTQDQNKLRASEREGVKLKVNDLAFYIVSQDGKPPIVDPQEAHENSLKWNCDFASAIQRMLPEKKHDPKKIVFYPPTKIDEAEVE
ncbi:MAG: hypothetical protein ACYS8L_10680 [Planctomycetota bacterium]|jgi:hypothetical protein